MELNSLFSQPHVHILQHLPLFVLLTRFCLNRIEHCTHEGDWPKTPYVSAPLFNSFSVSPWSRMENNLKRSLVVVLQSATLQRAPIFEKSNRLYLKTLTDNNILFLAVRGWQTFTIFPKFSGMVVFSWSLSRAVYRISFKSGSTKFKPRLNYFQFYSLACMWINMAMAVCW